MDHPLLQPGLALGFLYCGILMAIVFGMFDALHSSIRNTWLCYTVDFLCSVVLGSIFIAVSLLTTGGTLRFYPFFAASIGFWLERCTLHRTVCAKHLQRVHRSTSQSP